MIPDRHMVGMLYPAFPAWLGTPTVVPTRNSSRRGFYVVDRQRVGGWTSDERSAALFDGCYRGKVN